MKCTIDFDLCKTLSSNDYFYTMHRFIDNQIEWIEKAQKLSFVSVSIGVKEEDIRIIEKIKEKGLRVHYVTIDIAHAHHPWACQMIKTINANLNSQGTKIIAGNVATPEAANYLYECGAHAVKVGIGQGRACTTKDKTGFTIPMFTCTKSCGDCYASRDDFDAGRKIPIIADGGVKCNGDIAKALVAGADLVMAGGLFASCSDSPALSVDINGASQKAYFGSASFENKGHKNHIEGKLNHIANNGMTYEQKLEEIKQDLQSSISYAGGTNLSCFKHVKHFQL